MTVSGNNEECDSVKSREVEEDVSIANCEECDHMVELDNADAEQVDFDIESERKDQNEDLPVDRGWAWVILAASFIEMAIVIGYYKSFGIFFVQLQRRFSATSAATSVISSLQHAFYSFSAFLVMNLLESMTSRVSVVLGATMLSASFLMTGFMENLGGAAYFTGGILPGICFAFIHPQIVAVINTYFNKFRGLANNVAGCGVSIGTLSLAPLYTELFEYYGFTGTYIMAAGLFLNLVVVGTLLRPLENYKRRSKRYALDIVEIRLDKVHLIEKATTWPVDTSFCTCSNTNSQQTAQNQHKPYAYANGISQINASHVDIEIERIDPSCLKRSSKRCFSNFGEHIKGIPRNVSKGSIIKRPVFLYYLLCNVFLWCGCSLVGIFLAPHAVDAGISNELVSLLIGASAIADIFSKIVFGYLSDRKWIQRSTIMAVAAVVLGITSCLLYVMNTFSTIMVYAVISGSLQPVYYALYPVVAVDILSLDDLKNALGFIAVVQGVSLAGCLPLAGFLRDVTGRYHATFCFAGVLLVVGGILCFCLPDVKSRCDKKLAKDDTLGDRL